MIRYIISDSIGAASARLQYVCTQKGFSQSLRTNDNLYFQASSAKIKSDTSGSGGLNLKSGDIIGLEKSYAEF
ncbi:MAG TPA: hypothetical protein DEO71_00005, partial [Chryseobacterium sp.]|nr:hypothetical protein [Chryseobacterium sp.]